MTKTQKYAYNARSALAVVAAAALMTGCATSGNPKDPIEGFNRAMFSFNETVDKALIKPVAQGYDYVTPQPVQTGVSNFFDNIADLWIGFNNLIQGKPGEALSDVGRVLINTTVGIVGLFDVATGMGLEKHEEDFGQTLGRWGVGDGAYVVLPIFGPRTLRDTGGLLADVWVDPVSNHDPVDVRNIALALRAVDDRAGFLDVESTIEAAALDKYSYVRDAYLQRRRSLIHDGNPPRESHYTQFGPSEHLLTMAPIESTWTFMLVSAPLTERVEGDVAASTEGVAVAAN
ncbi:MAG: VacJ family lipoprotein [Methyloversatilis sp.]|jgi:phospholipid-binding lipoprotein MlaA|nr:VacJ family lipoprotein [Methyloversatilis sp.]MBP6194266.1 VacJ family lipoprotein [Methyloversatilis sp.]MBP9118773.1 VacJ family lipoprotein [Methyloversatilis sp.]